MELQNEKPKRVFLDGAGDRDRLRGNLPDVRRSKLFDHSLCPPKELVKEIPVEILNFEQHDRYKRIFDLGFNRDNLTIISGGQNGVDQAALRAAKTARLQTGGWATKGWRTLDGPREVLLTSFGLKEAPKESYPDRTARNVKDADVTIRIAAVISSPGERCTLNAIIKHDKPYIDLHVPDDLTDENAEELAKIIRESGWTTINVAGNSEKTAPGIGVTVEKFLSTVFSSL